MTGELHGRLGRLLGGGLAAKLVGPGFLSVAVKAASAVLTYLMLVVFARLLPADAYGQFGMAMNASIVLSVVAAIGLPVAVMRFWPALLELNQPAAAKGFALFSFRLLAFTSAALLALGVLLSLSGLADPWLGGGWGAVLVAAFAAVLAFSELLSGLLRAQGHTAWALIPRDVVWRLLAPVLAAAAMVLTGQFTSAMAIACCALLLALLTASQAARALRAIRSAAGAVAARTDWAAWRVSLIPIAGASMLFAMVQQLDVLVVGGLLGAEQAGAYFAAQKTASLLGLVMIAGGMVAAPLMAAAYHGNRVEELRNLCRLLAAAIALTTLVGFCVLAIIGEHLLAVFDPAYRSAYGVLMVLALGFAIDSLAGPTAYLMQMTKLEAAYLKIMAACYALVLVLQLIFVPIYGMVAAAAATAFGYVLWNGFAIALLRRRVGVDSSILSFFVAPSLKSHD